MEGGAVGHNFERDPPRTSYRITYNGISKSVESVSVT